MKIRKFMSFCMVTIIFSMLGVVSFAESGDVASIGKIGYKTLAEAISETALSGDITILSDIVLEETVVIPKGKNITIDLNGKVISGIDVLTNKNYELIKNQGTLTINDTLGTGKITLSATTDRVWNNYSSVIANHQGRVTINAGTIEHTGGTSMAYAIDNLTNGNGGDAILTIEGGKLVSSYRAIRQFGNSTTCENRLTINDGEILSTTSNKGAVWLTSANVKANKATLNINGGTISAVYVYATYGGDATALRLNIDEECVTSGVTYGNIEARIGEVYYGTLGKAVLAAEENDVIDMFNNYVEVNGEYEVPANVKIINGEILISDATTLIGNDVGITFENVNISNESTMDIGDVNIKILNGYFSFNPSSYLEEGKVGVTSDDSNYKFMVGEKNAEIEFDTSLEVQNPVVDIPEDINISGDFAVEETVLESAAADLANDEEIVGTKEEIINQIMGENEGDGLTGSVEFTVVVEPYINISVVDYVSGESKELALEISAQYDIVAKINNGDLEESELILKSGQKLEVSTPIEMTIALPDGFVEDGDTTVYIYHQKEDTTYVYEAEVIETANGHVAVFINPHGFSEFVVKTELEASAKNEETNTVYTTLEAAVSEVNNNQLITLLTDNEESVIVGKDITFSLNKDGYTFSGDVLPGRNTKVETTIDETTGIITYTFNYTKPSGGGSSSTYTVKFDTNGGSEIASIKVNKNTKLEEPEIPSKEGYSFEGWFVDKALTECYDFESKVTKNFTLYAKWSDENDSVNWENPFVDVNENDWFFEAVKFANQNGLFNGVSSTEFAPKTAMTRGMLVTVLYRLSGSIAEKTSTFVDVTEDAYYSNPIAWAAELGIVNGVGDNKFAPNDFITREQLATIMFRYMQKMEIDIPAVLMLFPEYNDAAEISSYAMDAIRVMRNTGLMEGKNDNNFDPKGTALRCEVATMLMRFVGKIEK